VVALAKNIPKQSRNASLSGICCLVVFIDKMVIHFCFPLVLWWFILV